MRRTIVGGAVLAASLLLGAGPALACGHPVHHKPTGGQHKPSHGTHKPREHKPRHPHQGKPCSCHKPKPPCPKPHPKPHRPPTHHHHGHKPPVVHGRPPVVTPPPAHHVKPPTAHTVTHRTTTARLVSASTPASLPRTGGTPWVYIFGGGALVMIGTAIRLAAPLRKYGHGE